MKKVYLKVLSSCFECPNMGADWNGVYYICQNKSVGVGGKILFHDNPEYDSSPPPIPKWCPLKNYDELQSSV